MNANTLYILGGVIIIIGTSMLYWSGYQKSKDSQNEIKNLRIQVTDLQSGNRELIDGKNDLLTLNKELNKKVEKYQEDLNEKDILIKKLEVKSIKSERGITLSYDFNGAKRETTQPGHINLNFGPEVEIFNQIVQLEKQKNYSEIIKICETQIKKTPEWLTPYLYLGVAYANTGNTSRAIELFSHVNKIAPNDPAYKQAREFLEKLSK